MRQGGVAGPHVEIEIDLAPPPVSETVVAAVRGPRITARVSASDGSAAVAELTNPLPTGAPLVFQVISSIDGPWLEVLLPVRPNGTTGWIEASEVDLSRNPYRIEIDTGDRRLVVRERGEVILDATVAIGTGSTPTPIGAFYITELLRPPDPDGPYGTHAFGLSGFSETLRSFNGGDGVVGIHGTNDPSSLGTEVSHGCVRVANETIDEMATFLPLGTPVVISR